MPLTFATQHVRWWRSRKLCVTSELSSVWEVQAEPQHALDRVPKLMKNLTTASCSLLSMLCPVRETSSWEVMLQSHRPSEDKPTLSPVPFITSSYLLALEQFFHILGIFKVTLQQIQPEGFPANFHANVHPSEKRSPPQKVQMAQDHGPGYCLRDGMLYWCPQLRYFTMANIYRTVLPLWDCSSALTSQQQSWTHTRFSLCCFTLVLQAAWTAFMVPGSCFFGCPQIWTRHLMV